MARTIVRKLKFLKIVPDAGAACIRELQIANPHMLLSFFLCIFLRQLKAFTDQNPAVFCTEGVLRP